MKKFNQRTISILLPFLLIVVGINYKIDPGNLFSNDFENSVSQAILSNKNVTNIYNYDERKLQKAIIAKIDYCPEIAVIGSSRTMLIKSLYFPNKTFFNNSVSGASIEDLIAIFKLYENKNCVPKTIILGLDPWTLNKNNEQTRWSSLTKEYNMFLKEVGRKPLAENNNNYFELLSPSYFQSALKMMRSKKGKPIITESPVNKEFTKRSDGSISYDEAYRNASEVEINRKTEKYINGEIYSIENFDTLSKENIYLLEKFISKMKSKNVEVIFFLAPYHPLAYKFIASQPKYAKVIESEKYYISLAKKNNIKVVASFNPDLINASKNMFYDGMHSNEEGIARWFNYNQQK